MGFSEQEYGLFHGGSVCRLAIWLIIQWVEGGVCGSFFATCSPLTSLGKLQ